MRGPQFLAARGNMQLGPSNDMNMTDGYHGKNAQAFVNVASSSTYSKPSGQEVVLWRVAVFRGALTTANTSLCL